MGGGCTNASMADASPSAERRVLKPPMAPDELLTACRLGGSALDTELVKGLLGQPGVDVNRTDDTKWTAVHWCTRNGAAAALRELCAAGADVNAADGFHTTALHLACRDGRADVCAVLLQHGAHVNCKTEDMLTPAHLAAKGGYVDAIKALAAARPPLPPGSAAPQPAQPPPDAAPKVAPDASSPEAAPAAASDAEGSGEAVSDSAPEPAPPSPAAPAYDPCGPLRLEERDAKGLTALQWACMKDQPEAVAALIALGSDVESADVEGKTCLMVASELGTVACITQLIAAGADLDAQAKNGRTAVVYAAREGQAEALKCLVRAGAGVTGPKDADGNSALSLSCRRVVNSVLDADPSRLFLNDRNYLACFTSCLGAVSQSARMSRCMGLT